MRKNTIRYWQNIIIIFLSLIFKSAISDFCVFDLLKRWKHVTFMERNKYMKKIEKKVITSNINELPQKLSQQEWASITDLSISGQIGEEDLKFLCFLSRTFRVLSVIDLTEVTNNQIVGNLQQCPSVTTILLPSNLKAIPDSMFMDCNQLEFISMSDSVNSIGQTAMQGCRKLKSVTMSKSIEFIGSYAFRGCLELENIALGNRLKTIGDAVFQFCYKLKHIDFPATTQSIGRDLFVSTPSLEAINVEPGNKNFSSLDGVLYSEKDGQSDVIICYPAFHKGKTFVIGNNLKIEPNTFYECFLLENIIVDPQNPNYTSEDGILYNKDKTAIIRVPSEKQIKTFLIADSVKNIVPNAFRFCHNIETIKMSDNILHIDGAFFGCDHLKDIRISKSVTTLLGAFQGCKKLEQIEIPQNVVDISSAFCGCTEIQELSIHKGIKHINGAFWGCSNLRKVSLPDSLEEIGNQTFCGCSNLEEITLPTSLTKLGDMAFAGSGIREIALPAIMRIGNGAFRDCKKLGNVTFTEGTICINTEAFLGCSSLNAITFPDSLKRICDGSFVNCTSLETLKIPQNCENIGNGAFTNCKSLSSIHCLSHTPPKCQPYTFDGININCVIHVPTISLNLYKKDSIWGALPNIVTA